MKGLRPAPCSGVGSWLARIHSGVSASASPCSALLSQLNSRICSGLLGLSGNCGPDLAQAPKRRIAFTYRFVYGHLPHSDGSSL